jgi:hypothetical protein
MSVQSKAVRFSVRLAAWASSAAVLTCGCGLESSGLGDATNDEGGTTLIEDAASTGATDGTINVGNDGAPSSDDAAVGDSASDQGAPRDTGSDAVGTDGCASNVEVCNNGVDDDCNGLIDCADPECANWQCTPEAVPAGWTVVEYASSTTPPASCGTGYATSSNVYEGPFAPASCPCGCTLTASGSCVSGSYAGIVANPAGMCNGPSTSVPAGDGACQAIPAPGYTPAAGAKEEITPVPYTPGTCQPNGSTTKPAITENGYVCAKTVASGAGCANSGSCVPPVQSGYSLCIEQAGTSSCPSGFSNVHDVGSGTTDTRTCSACTCAPPTAQCDSAMVTIFTDPQCGTDGGTATVQANGECNSLLLGSDAATAAFHAYEYSATLADEACGMGASTASGGVALTGPSTICCK